EIEIMKKVLAEKGVDLDKLITEEFDDDEQREARVRLQGDPIGGDIEGLVGNGGTQLTGNQKLAAAVLIPGGPLMVPAADALLGDRAIGADKDRILEILERNKGDMTKFAEEFEKRTGKPLSEFLRQNGLADEAKGLGVPEPPRD